MPKSTLPPISLFVAMPYTKLGDNSKWGKPQSVAAFYVQVAKRISQKMKRKVQLRIEKDTPKSGLVIGEMFQAIRDADVFIADVTGANANVFLELGVRYGVSDKVTILTTQEDTSPPFDINQIAVVRYADGPTQKAEKHIAEIVFNEFNTPSGGSPILRLLEAQVVPRRQWEIFSGERIQIMLHHARQEHEAQRRIQILREAVGVDPFSSAAQLELLKSLREMGQLDEALLANDEAVRRIPRCMPLLKERGKVLDKLTARGEDRLDEAIEAFSQALQLAESDGDLHGCLGGVLRRKALCISGAVSTALLDQAFAHYLRSLEIDRHSTYAGMNLLRLVMLGASPTPAFPTSEGYLKRMFHLCAFEVADTQCRENGETWWPMFDLADILLLQNELDRAIETYSQAIQYIPPLSRNDTLLSPLRTWKELLEFGALAKKIAGNVENVVQLLESEYSLNTPDRVHLLP